MFIFYVLNLTNCEILNFIKLLHTFYITLNKKNSVNAVLHKTVLGHV